MDEKNNESKGVVGSIIREIKKKIEDRGVGGRSVLVFGNPEWKPSLLGLVVNSFSDEHERPAFFWGRNGESDGLIKGSCRSGGNLNIVRLMEKVKDLLSQIDVLLIMSIEIGFQGQPFIPGALEKIKEALRLRSGYSNSCRIAVDGAVSVENIG